MCMNEMASIDARGGLGLAGLRNVLSLQYDKSARRGAATGKARTYVASVCTPGDTDGSGDTDGAGGETRAATPRLASPILGAGLARPSPPFRFSTESPPSSTRPSNS
jgi:cytochrome o ubiquinol oxidase subunit 2